MLLDEEKLLLSGHFVYSLGHEVEHAVFILVVPVDGREVSVGPVSGRLVA